jgi:hypothetical protein
MDGGRRLLKAVLASWSRREVNIKGGGVSVQLKGSDDINAAIRAFQKAAAISQQVPSSFPVHLVLIPIHV